MSMGTLADILSNQQTAASPTPNAGAGEQTEGLKGILSAGSNAGSSLGGPRTSALGEEQAAKESATEKSVQDTQGAQAASALLQKGQELQEQRASGEADVGQRLSTIRKMSDDQRANTIAQYQEAQRTQDVSEQGAKAEQLAFDARFADGKYIDDLKQAGDMARLEDAQAFRLAAAKDAFGQTEDLLNHAAGNQQALNMSANDYAKVLANVDINMAIALATANIKQDQLKGQYEGVGGMTSGAIKAYDTYQQTPTKAGDTAAAKQTVPQYGPNDKTPYDIEQERSGGAGSAVPQTEPATLGSEGAP